MMTFKVKDKPEDLRLMPLTGETMLVYGNEELDECCIIGYAIDGDTLYFINTMVDVIEDRITSTDYQMVFEKIPNYIGAYKLSKIIII